MWFAPVETVMPSIPPNAGLGEGGDPPDVEIGALFPGTRYRVLALIGRGGMGRVYEVEHVELGKRFVLKSLLHDLEGRHDLVARLRNEWRALARLDHPNIVLVTDAGTTELGTPFFVMERLEGETLGQRLRRERRLSVPEALRIGLAILDGLSAAHDIGVIHRDVKPPNVFLRSDAGVKLLDFGVAKTVSQVESITIKGVAVGTPRYMSPEQARGAPLDGRADLYATGLVIYEMIAGVSPFFDVRDANQLLLAHILKKAPALSSAAPGVSPELDAFVARLLAKDPRERPGSARHAADALRALAAHRESLAPSLSAAASLSAGFSVSRSAVSAWRPEVASDAVTIPVEQRASGTLVMGDSGRASGSVTLPLDPRNAHARDATRDPLGALRPAEATFAEQSPACMTESAPPRHIGPGSVSGGRVGQPAWGQNTDTVACAPPSGTLPVGCGPTAPGTSTVRMSTDEAAPLPPGDLAPETHTAVPAADPLVNSTPPPIEPGPSPRVDSASGSAQLVQTVVIAGLGLAAVVAVVGASFWWKTRPEMERESPAAVASARSGTGALRGSEAPSHDPLETGRGAPAAAAAVSSAQVVASGSPELMALSSSPRAVSAAVTPVDGAVAPAVGSMPTAERRPPPAPTPALDARAPPSIGRTSSPARPRRPAAPAARRLPGSGL